jgi:hypothetical protein
MSGNGSSFGWVYLDPDVLRTVVEHSGWYCSFFNFLFRNRLRIAFSDSLLVELGRVEIKEVDFTRLFAVLPWGKVKNFEKVIDEEVESYPNSRVDSLLFSPERLGARNEAVDDLLVSNRVEEQRKKQLIFVDRMKKHLEYVKAIFPPSRSGVYTKEQAEVFAWMVTVQWLRRIHPDFIGRLNDKKVLLRAEAFRSIKLFAYVVYYKYYLGKRQPKDLTNFGELFHLFYFPYCKLIILGRETWRIVNEIKSDCKALDGVEVKNVDFFQELQRS